MQFKSPGGELVWLTILWAVGGLGLGIYECVNGSPILGGILISLGVFSALVWLDMKWVAYPLAGYFSLAFVGLVISFFSQGFSWLLLLKIAMVVYTVVDLLRWAWGWDFEDSEESDEANSNMEFASALSNYWKFDQPADSMVITTNSITNHGADVLFVSHDADDHGWQFLDSNDPDEDEMTTALFFEMLLHDESINDLTDLPQDGSPHATMSIRLGSDLMDVRIDWQRAPSPSKIEQAPWFLLHVWD